MYSPDQPRLKLQFRDSPGTTLVRMAKINLRKANECSIEGCSGTVTGTVHLKWLFGFPNGEVGAITAFDFPLDDDHLEQFRDGNQWPMNLTVTGVTMKPGKERPRGAGDRRRVTRNP